MQLRRRISHSQTARHLGTRSPTTLQLNRPADMARANISERVAALGDLSRSELIDHWVKNYGVEPPIGIRQAMLLRAAARHIQEKQLGGLSPTGKRLLKIAVKRVACANDTARVEAGG